MPMRYFVTTVKRFVYVLFYFSHKIDFRYSLESLEPSQRRCSNEYSQSMCRAKMSNNVYPVYPVLLYENGVRGDLNYEPRCEKPVFGVSDQVPHKPGCATTQDG